MCVCVLCIGVCHLEQHLTQLSLSSRDMEEISVRYGLKMGRNIVKYGQNMSAIRLKFGKEICKIRVMYGENMGGLNAGEIQVQ